MMTQKESRAGADPVRPFAGFEWLIAWRYLRSRRQEGGVSVMTWISLAGIALSVFALIATLGVRSGFRTEFTATILGANAHVTIYPAPGSGLAGRMPPRFENYSDIREAVAAVPGVTRAAPLVRGQVLATANGSTTGVEVYGETPEDLATLPLVSSPEDSLGRIEGYGRGIAIGTGVARELGVAPGDSVTLVSPDGIQTAFGTAPRIDSFEVAYVFGVGRYDIDSTRVYMPLMRAQAFFGRSGTVDEFEVMVAEPERIHSYSARIIAAAGPGALLWTWKDSSGAFLRALQMEDNIMFIILSLLVLVAALNIVSGLVMLVKNKGREIGILRTMGLGEGSILRIFFICGASIGVVGTVAGVMLGCLFVIYIDPVFAAVNYLAGGGVWDPSVRFLSRLPARLELGDVLSAVGVSLSLSFIATIFPARRAARMDPVEALRYE